MTIENGMTEDTTQSTEPMAQDGPKALLGILLLLTLAGLLVGIWWLFPYLVEEHKRMEWWKGVLVWVADAMSLFWFIGYCAVHYLFSEPLQSQPIQQQADPQTVANSLDKHRSGIWDRPVDDTIPDDR